MIDIVTSLCMCLLSFGVLVFTYTVSPTISCFLAPSNYAASDKKKKVVQNTRVTGIIFSACCSLAALYQISTDAKLQSDHLWGYSWQSGALISACVAFFVADLFLLQYADFPPLLTYVHHSVATYVYLLQVVYQACTFFAVLRLVTELSTPFVLMRGVYKEMDIFSQRMRLINDVVGTLLFTITRVLFLPFYYYFVYQDLGTEGFHRLNFAVVSGFLGGGVIIDAINVYWFWRILQAMMIVSSAKTEKHCQVDEA